MAGNSSLERTPVLQPGETDHNTPVPVYTLNGGSGGTSAVDKAAGTVGVSSGTPAMGLVTPGDTVASGKLALAAMQVDRSLNVYVTGQAGGGSAVSVADGADVTQGAIADAAVSTDTTGTLSGKLRGIVKLLVSVISVGRLVVDPSGVTSPVSAAALPLPSGASTSAQIGEVQASPTANTVLDRLKALLTGIVLSAGSALIGKVGIDQTTPGTTNLVAAGGVGAAAAAVAGNPVRLGALGRTILPTIVASAQLVDILADRYGRAYVIAPVLTVLGSAATPITTNTTTSIVAAPSAGNHLRIHRLWCQNSSATGTWMYWCDGTTKRIPVYLAQYQPFSIALNGSWELATASALQIITSTTGANIEWFVEYETLAD
jgi:hypothetical protein